ncbi:MAG: type II CRISPR-associated endonuclease Cas1 [Gammaproteobacteria bacterium]|nr:type II CRISPR-associated endonuclease Cas1 [Gammaproteobacteria bacterium]
MVSEHVAPARVVEIATPGRYLSMHRGFLVVKGGGMPDGKTQLDDIGCLIIAAPGASISTNLVAALAERNVPVVTVGGNFLPACMLFPLTGSGLLASRLQAQAESKLPTRKRLWADVIRRKIAAQSALLERFDHRYVMRLRDMARRVRSGDPDNFEAQAARLYWRGLMGKTFRRDRALPGANALLNYGYTVLRAATARAICAAGLHPMLGLHHLTRGDGLRLADDLMEPFRPAVDMVVKSLADEKHTDLDAAAKAQLVSAINADYKTAAGTTPLSSCLVRLAQSVGDVFLGQRRAAEFPVSPLPLPESAAGREQE